LPFKGKPIDDTVEFPFLDIISQKVREIGIEAHIFPNPAIDPEFQGKK
jgi:hypothetical protein